MAQAAIQIHGVKDLMTVCKVMEDKISVKEMKAAHKKAAETVLPVAQDRMPEVSGDLRDSYYAKGLQSGGVVGSDLVYGKVSEFGGRIPNRGHAGKHQHKPTAKSIGEQSYFIYPAVEEKRDDIAADYRDEILRIAAKYFHTGIGG